MKTNDSEKSKMRNPRITLVLSVMLSLLGGAFAVSLKGEIQPQVSDDEQTVWNLERAYWRYVESNDLSAYSDLWHQNFLGWPSVTAAPVHKDHITDWITSQTSKGLAFKAGELKPAAMQMTGNVAFACYWITFKWLDKDGNGAPRTLRITHAWLKTGKDWSIVGGMSMPEPETPQKSG